MAGRIEAYIHSDRVVPNKGGCLVEVKCQTDFGARTDTFIAFAQKVAKLMFGYGAEHWQELTEHSPALESERCQLELDLKERVQVSRVVALRLDNGREQTSKEE
jgi:translation elongation factor EF-Ts